MAEADIGEPGESPVAVDPVGDSDPSDAEQSNATDDLEEVARRMVEEEGGEVELEAEAKEPPKEATKSKPEEEKKPDEDEVARGFAKLTAEQRRLKKRQGEFGSEKAEFAAEREAFAKEREEYAAKVAKAKQDPETALAELGWTLEQFVDFLTHGKRVPPEKLIHDLQEENKKQIEQIQKDREEAKKAYEDQVRETQANKWATNLRSHLDGELQSGKYPHLATQDADETFESLRTHILAQYQKTGQTIAPGALLQYYEDRLSKMASRLGRQVAPQQNGAVQSAKSEAAKPTREPTQVTNRDSSERGVREPPDDETDEMRWERARQVLAS